MNEHEILLPAEAARRLGVETRVIIKAMHEQKIPRVKLADGTLGIPSEALNRLPFGAPDSNHVHRP